MLNYNIELNQIRSGSDIRVSDDDIEDLEQYIESKLDGESINDIDNNELVINFEGTIENLIKAIQVYGVVFDLTLEITNCVGDKHSITNRIQFVNENIVEDGTTYDYETCAIEVPIVDDRL